MFKFSYFKLFSLILGLALTFYLLQPSPEFPGQFPGAKRSTEPADSESPLRRAYFLDGKRGEVISFYEKQFSTPLFSSLKMPTYRLNYPPEEAKVFIRDQTRSTYLEEIVHPFRESIFINGFEPKVAKDLIVIEGIPYEQKIIVKYFNSSLFTRLFFILTGYIFLLYLIEESLKAFSDLWVAWVKNNDKK